MTRRKNERKRRLLTALAARALSASAGLALLFGTGRAISRWRPKRPGEIPRA